MRHRAGELLGLLGHGADLIGRRGVVLVGGNDDSLLRGIAGLPGLSAAFRILGAVADKVTLRSLGDFDPALGDNEGGRLPGDEDVDDRAADTRRAERRSDVIAGAAVEPGRFRNDVSLRHRDPRERTSRLVFDAAVVDRLCVERINEELVDGKSRVRPHLDGRAVVEEQDDPGIGGCAHRASLIEKIAFFQSDALSFFRVLKGASSDRDGAHVAYNHIGL